MFKRRAKLLDLRNTSFRAPSWPRSTPSWRRSAGVTRLGLYHAEQMALLSRAANRRVLPGEPWDDRIKAAPADVFPKSVAADM
jgi:hypothetical protein